MTIYNLGNIKGEKGDKGDSVTGPTGPVGVGIKSIEQITHTKFKFCLTDGSEYIINYGDEPTFDGISVSSTKDILSFADGDSTVLSAQLTNGGQPVGVSGESVTFEVRKVSDDSLVESLTGTTNSNGEVTVEYFGKGDGDLNIKIKCRSFIETYEVQDCIKYIANPTDNQSISFPTGDFKIEWLVNADTTHNLSAIKDGNNNWVGLASSNRQIGFYNPNNLLNNLLSDNTDTIFTLTRSSGTYTFSALNESVSDNRTFDNSSLVIRNTANKMQNFKVKPL